MSTGFLVSLGVVVAAILGARFLISALPLRAAAAPMTVTDVALAGLGVGGLAFHCGAMFFRPRVEALPGTPVVIRQINALGTASIIYYAIPALVVLLGLRRQHPITLTIVTAALAGVAVTMYDGGSLHTHLTAIFLSVVVLACVAAMLVVVRPSRPGPAGVH